MLKPSSKSSSVIDDPKLAAQGEEACEWFRLRMPVLRAIGERLSATRPFEGRRIAVCLHVEPKLVVWIEALLAGGAEEVAVVGCLGSTQPESAAYLAARERVRVYALKEDDWRTHQEHVDRLLAEPWHVIIDNGSSLTTPWHQNPPGWSPLGSTEETRSGKLRLLASRLDIHFPVIVVDDSPLKRMIENTLGVGQSVVDGILRATSLLMGGKRALVLGYGWCGQGICRRLQGMGALPMVCEIDPLRRLQAKLEGYLVGSLENLLPLADFVITATGRDQVIGADHAPLLRQDAILCNAGHFSTEIDVPALAALSSRTRALRKDVTSYEISGKRFFLLDAGHLVNLAAADGNPIEVMDLGLALQALSASAISLRADQLPCALQPVPDEVNREVAELCLTHF